MEVKNPETSPTRKLHERRRRSYWWQDGAVEISGEVNLLKWAAGDSGGDKSSRQTCEHLGAVKGEWLWAQEGGARRVEHVHAHVISIGPDTKVGIVEKIRAKVKAVAVVTARGITGCGNCHALISWYTCSCELADDPTVRNLVIEHNGVPVSCGF